MKINKTTFIKWWQGLKYKLGSKLIDFAILKLGADVPVEHNVTVELPQPVYRSFEPMILQFDPIKHYGHVPDEVIMRQIKIHLINSKDFEKCIDVRKRKFFEPGIMHEPNWLTCAKIAVLPVEWLKLRYPDLGEPWTTNPFEP